MTTRRGFLSGLLAVAVAEAIPFNRVWFLPKNIVVPKTYTTYLVGQDAILNATIGQYKDYIFYADTELASIYYEMVHKDTLKANVPFQNTSQYKPLPKSTKEPIQFYRYKLTQETI